MSLLKKFEEQVIRQNLFSKKDRLLLAVSGGVDSVVLCELCHRGGFEFLIAHCNFQLRGEESGRDEEFVRNLAKKYKVECFVKKFETESYAAEYKLSIQEAARALRYNWFAQLAEEQRKAMGLHPAGGDQPGAKKKDPSTKASVPHSPTAIYLLTAHHSDDNAETLLMNFFRGTGLKGLTGIPVSAGFLRRPLLEFSKEELLAFAREQGLDYVEDSSNLSLKYTRNYVRLELLPAIGKAYPKIKENLQDNIHRFREIEKLYREAVDRVIRQLCRQKGDELHIPVKQLMAWQNKALLYEIIFPYGFQEKQVEELVKLSESASGKYILSPSGSHRILRHRHWFIIGPVSSGSTEHISIEAGTKNVSFDGSELLMETTRNPPTGTGYPASQNTGYFDLQQLQFPLLLRKWKTGDYFYPLGMKKKKKLSRFFIDQKLSQAEKEKIWVLESNQRICWVLGHRIDERFKVLPGTRELLRITIR